MKTVTINALITMINAWIKDNENILSKLDRNEPQDKPEIEFYSGKVAAYKHVIAILNETKK